MHEKDGNGKWQNIEFGLSLKQVQGEQVYVSGATGSAFSANYSPNRLSLMRLGDEDTSVSMTMIVPQTSISTWARQSAVTAKVTHANYNYHTIEQAVNANFSSSVLYEEIMPGIDLEYVIEPFVVKENIVVKEVKSKYEYAFRLDLTGLYPVLTEENSIMLYDTDTGKLKYKIPAPYMYDSDGYISYDVYYSLVDVSGIYYLTVTASPEWINADERNFPVTIDPTYMETAGIVEDTYVSSTLPNCIMGSQPDLWVRGNRISYIKTATPSIPSNMYLHYASLITYYFYNDGIESGYVDVTAHQVYEPWSANRLSWNVASELANYGMSTKVLSKRRADASVIATTNNPERLDFDITEAVRAWENGEYNRGIGLRYANTSTNYSVVFKASDTGTTYAPRIVYQYGPTFKFAMELQYDKGYLDRYGAPTSRISAEAAAVKTFFANTYNVDIQYKTPQEFVSYADMCPAGAGNDFYYEYACACGTCQTTDLESVVNLYDAVLESYHHKNIKNIMARLQAPTTSLSATVAYIGHNTCDRNGASHGENLNRGLAVPKFRIATITNGYSQNSEAVTLAHELGHMLGILDHYNSGDADCLYGTNGSKVHSFGSVKVCQNCKNKVAEFISQYEG